MLALAGVILLGSSVAIFQWTLKRGKYLPIIKTHPLVKSRTYESFSYQQGDGFPT